MSSGKEFLTWGGKDAFTHSLIVGPTRCGKTATVIKPIIETILEERAKGKKVGLSIIEPKGDVVRDVKEICDAIGEPMVYIDPLNPKESDTINVMKGPTSDIAEATASVLKSMFGKQEAFFQTVQELSTRKITTLLKRIYGDNMYLVDVLANLRSETKLKQNVERLRQMNTDPELVSTFDDELLNGKDAEKFRQHVLGLRAQLDNLMSNEYLKPLISQPSTFDLDEHFRKGGILGINTAIGKLAAAGDAFGQFVAMHLQLATFRREGTELTRIPHYLIADEYSRYINPDVERFLSIAAEYRVAGIFAIQSTGQLEVESGKISARAMKKAIMDSTRNKIIFGGLAAQTAKELSEELGKDLVREREQTFDGNPLKQLHPRMVRDREVEKERFPFTVLMDGIPAYHFIHKLVINGQSKPPGIARGRFLPQDIEVRKKRIKRFQEERLEERYKILQEEVNNIPKWKVKELIKKKKEMTILAHRLNEKEEKQKRFQEAFKENPFDKHEESTEQESVPTIIYESSKPVRKNEVPTAVAAVASTATMPLLTATQTNNKDTSNAKEEVESPVHEIEEDIPFAEETYEEENVDTQDPFDFMEFLNND
ncbi:type IV secretory system conjugative DNA transfer family protein [Alkalihalobacillus oceani]|uniref:Type IV secretory system conjugative DNA transfer family protein n=1 Tax=Halalkalibacter oceani TaxID=1653776 RepID=A0A9X2IPP5_9BACI|nr:type IV secretory system conjugative DNA transfer family protein [Halalkalibacter oceani]MCM3716269.1 type IV secretory system conjugative DNA transfer family protein [Halalkalibacter oceani]